MRLSDFRRLLVEEFGEAYAASLASSQHLAAVGGHTPDEALEAGWAPREVWNALCDAMDVPPERRLGRDVPLRRR